MPQRPIDSEIPLSFRGRARNCRGPVRAALALQRNAAAGKPERLASGRFEAVPENYRTASLSIRVLGTLWRFSRPSSSVSITVATGPTSRTVPSMPATKTRSPECSRCRV